MLPIIACTSPPIRCEGHPGNVGADSDSIRHALWIQREYIAALGAGQASARRAYSRVFDGDCKNAEDGRAGA